MTTLKDSLLEADRQVDAQGIVWDTLRRIVSELDRLGIPYAVVGGIALQHYGIQRSTQDVDMLVTAADLKRIHGEIVGHGYAFKSPGSRHLRDDVTRVRIEFLVTGDYPGDGQPKPVKFDAPAAVREVSSDGIAFVNLPTLIEMKLASAMTAAHRIKDRADVLELIHTVGLGADFADQLDPYVRDEFRSLAVLPPPSERD